MRRFKKLLLYVGTEQNSAAMTRAVQLAKENDASLTLMDVVKPVPKALGMLADLGKPLEVEKQIAQDHRQKLSQTVAKYSDNGIRLDVVVAIGDPAHEIVQRVMDEQYDLVMKTADGLSVSGRLFGSVAKSLLRKCPCPVWILKPERHGEFDVVLAAVDVNADDEKHIELNRRILKLAHSVAQRENAELHVVGAWELWMESSLRRRAGNAQVDVEVARHESRVHETMNDLIHVDYAKPGDFHRHLHRGPAADVIRDVAEKIEADLLVMGTVCRTKVAGFLIGNTAESVLGYINCSVLALKPSGFVSPVEFAADAKRTNDQTQSVTV